jgi:hypothetical protein
MHCNPLKKVKLQVKFSLVMLIAVYYKKLFQPCCGEGLSPGTKVLKLFKDLNKGENLLAM